MLNRLPLVDGQSRVESDVFFTLAAANDDSEFAAFEKKRLQAWIDVGVLEHDNKYDQCLPDFSCCNHALLWPKDKRQLFVGTDSDEVRIQMLQDHVASLTGPEVFGD